MAFCLCLFGAGIAGYGLYQLLLPHTVGIPQAHVRIGIILGIAGYLLYWVGRVVHWYYWR